MTEHSYMEIVKERLARGEITIEEYQVLLAELGGGNSNAIPASHNERGHIVASVDDISVYEHCVLVGSVERALNQISSIRGGVQTSSFNGVIASKTTHLWIKFLDGQSIGKKEDSAWFGRKRHAAIAEVYRTLRSQTFKNRMSSLIARLRDCGQLPLGDAGVFSNDPVVLYVDGSIGNTKHRFGIRHAREYGSLQLGVGRFALSGSTSSSPFEIVISDKKRLRGIAVPIGHKIDFEPTCEDPDIVLSLIEWMSEPGNML